MTTTLADVEILERIGEGGSADVFAARVRGRDVAVKVLRDPDRAGQRTRFLREGYLLRRLSHPGILRCYEVLDGEQPALVLERLAGEPLNRRIARGPVPGDEVVLLASAMLRALAYLHERGIVHRDVKSSNVYLAEDRRVVLMDLGLASDPGHPIPATLGEVLGTHAYMAPEQIAGAETDHRCDLYSLGITLYEALSGTRPYVARGLGGYLRAHRAGGARPIVEIAPGTPIRLATLVDRLMARDPAARPPSAAVALALLTGTSGIRRALEPPALIGREGARGAIAAVIDAGGVLRIRGELGSGLGATALLALRTARRERVAHVSLRCRSRSGPRDAVAALARELDALDPPVEPTEEGVRDAIARRKPGERLLLVVEDLDLGPPELPALLDRLAELPDLAIVVTATLMPPLPRGRTIELRPLAEGETRRLAASMLGSAAVPAGLAEAIHDATGGLPAFAAAILREQAARGALWCDGLGEDGAPRWAWDRSSRLLPGDDTARRFQRALDTLGPEPRLLVNALAVAGEAVPFDVAIDATGLDPSGEALGAVLDGGIVELRVVEGEEWLALRRAALAPLIAATTEPWSRRQLHLALASAVRARAPGDWERRFLYAHEAAGSLAPAHVARLVELGDWLVAGARPHHALVALDAALALPVDDPRTVALLALARGDALRALCRLDEARAALNAARPLARDAADAVAMRRCHLAEMELALSWGTPVPDEAREAVVAAAHDDVPRAFLLLAEEQLRAGDFARARELAAYARDLAPPGPVDAVAIAARLLLAREARLRGESADAVPALRTLIGELDREQRPGAAGEVWLELAACHHLDADLSASEDALRHAEELARRHHLPWTLASAALLRASVGLVTGDLAGARELLRSHAACGEASAPWGVRSSYAFLLARVRAAVGDAPAALAAHQRAADVAEAGGDLVGAAFHTGMAAMYTADAEAIMAAIERLRDIPVPRLRALLLVAGARESRDVELLAAAEADARGSGDRLLLLYVLHALRRDRPEARAIAERALAGVSGPLRRAFLAMPDVTWALGERSAG